MTDSDNLKTLEVPTISRRRDPAPTYLSARESEPHRFQWMKGFPPPKDRLLSAIDGSFFQFPALRYSVCHMREFLPTLAVASAQENRYKFVSKLDPDIDDISFIRLDNGEKMTWKESLEANYTDGILILHKGRIVYEKYFSELTPERHHAVMSVSKTIIGTIGAMLVTEGVLQEDKTCQYYIPEVKGSGFADATVRQVLDMTTSLKYQENYADPDSDIWAFSAAGSPFPHPKEYTGARNYYQYLVTLEKAQEHGKTFSYLTVNADMMGWLVSKVLNKNLADIVSSYLWKPLGCHYDAYYQNDSAGIAFAGGGFNAVLRDLAKFAQMILNNGYFNGRQVLPEATLLDIKEKGDLVAFACSKFISLKGWSYRNMWWKTNNPNNAFCARGVHGQTIYIDPAADVAMIRLGSHPVAANSANDPTSLPAFAAVAEYLKSNASQY